MPMMERRTIAWTGILLLLAACGGAPEQEKEVRSERFVVGGEDASELAEKLYQMPTPNELFVLVRQMAGEGQMRMMSDARKADRFVTLEKRAANFGIYATDLVYASYFKLQVEVVRYYLTVKKLGDQLGLASAFPDKDRTRLESNLAHGDSLEVISNEAYFRAYQKMQDEEMGPVLALVLAGGWVESMHLVMEQIHHYDPADPLVQRIAEQKVSLEHLLDMMEHLKEDSDLSNIRERLIAIRSIYDGLDVRRIPHQGATGSGRMVLGEDVHIDLTEAKYQELVSAVEALRNYLTTPDDKAPTI